MTTAPQPAAQHRIFTGTVVADRMDKTVTVRLVRTKRHPKYQKRYQVSMKVLAHDPQNAYHVGDVVRIRETRPYSKRKRWIVIERAEKPHA
ncbi:MAG: 30S ribosomal protein S17 [Candidatus Kerfeldbacteria bacterium]|nr:30S ribosomal protein S17 [Candidatus Kerfeldbacteria bacterium]